MRYYKINVSTVVTRRFRSRVEFIVYFDFGFGRENDDRTHTHTVIRLGPNHTRSATSYIGNNIVLCSPSPEGLTYDTRTMMINVFYVFLVVCTPYAYGKRSLFAYFPRTLRSGGGGRRVLSAQSSVFVGRAMTYGKNGSLGSCPHHSSAAMAENKSPHRHRPLPVAVVPKRLPPDEKPLVFHGTLSFCPFKNATSSGGAFSRAFESVSKLGRTRTDRISKKKNRSRYKCPETERLL